MLLSQQMQYFDKVGKSNHKQSTKGVVVQNEIKIRGIGGGFSLTNGRSTTYGLKALQNNGTKERSPLSGETTKERQSFQLKQNLHYLC